MLNKNLAKIRKERGLTQESLAAKLNVVRQTVSKWEQGTAVPDAEMLCRIAEALDIPVTELLGTPAVKAENDTTAIVKVLAEINEQLALKNRRTHRIWKIIGIIFLVGILSSFMLVATSLIAFQPFKNSEDVSVVQVSEEGVPLLASVSELDDSEINEYLSKIVTREQLIKAWGEPEESGENRDYWKLDDQWKLLVSYDENGVVVMCGKEN